VTKIVPLRLSYLPDSGGIFTFSKRSPYGEDIAICPPSQTSKNFGMLTVHVRTVRTFTWQGRTIRTMMWHPMTWQDPVGCQE
jgi:hypothetical protein